MKGLVRIAAATIVLGVICFVLGLWYNIYIVGQYYASANILLNVVVGGFPLWLLIAIIGGWKLVKEEQKL